MSELTKLRKSIGLSIDEAAEKLGISGGYLSQIERGQRQLSADRAKQIATLYGKNREDIFSPTRYAVRVVGGHEEQLKKNKKLA